MDYGGDPADDQSSGWFEVKKKHRNNSKYSLQSWVGGLSGKRPPHSQRGQVSYNEKSGNLQGKQRFQPQKSAGVSLGQSSVATCSKDVQVVSDLNKCVANQDVEHAKSPPIVHTETASIVTEIGESPENEKVDVPKIKWGDLDDDALSLHHEKSGCIKIKFGNIEDDNLNVSMDIESNSHSSKSGISSSSLDKNLGKSHDVKNATDISSAEKDKILEKNEKVLDGAIPKNVDDSAVLASNQPSVPAEESMMDGIQTVIKSEVDSSENSTIPVGNNPSALDEEVMPDLGNKIIQYELEDSTMPDATVNSRAVVSFSDVNSLDTEKSGHRRLEEPIGEATAGDGKTPVHGTTCEGKLNDQIMDCSGGTDIGESKERFRERLWCFLFENLNRAVDELYLLCELECDIEQMNEAILVLAEAGSDFKELKTRVEDFEGIKSSSSQVADGTTITLKSNHRRPHALSWEVRRMTTSPHKAEILSSSLEAFKKIQQERASVRSTRGENMLEVECLISQDAAAANSVSHSVLDATDSSEKYRKHNGGGEKNIKGHNVQNGGVAKQHSSYSDMKPNKQQNKDNYAASVSWRGKRDQSVSETEKLLSKRDRKVAETNVDKTSKSIDQLSRRSVPPEKDVEKRYSSSWKSMDAWKEKRNWEDILSSPYRVSSRISHSPGLSRKSADRARILHDKLMSPEKKKKNALDLKKEAEEKHARAMRIRAELESERMQKFQRTSEKLNRVNEWQAVRSMKLREGMYARHQRSESRHEAYIAQVVRRAGDQSSKVNEVRFITSLNEENKKLSIRQKLHDSEMRRAEKLQVLRAKQKEDIAREEAALERRKLMEAEKLQRLAEIQRRKEEAQLRREEERKASSAAREARAIEQQRRKEERAKAQQEEAELLAQKLAEKLRESEQRRKFYLEQIRERASMDFRDQSSPLVRRTLLTNNGEDSQSNSISVFGGSLPTGNFTLQHPLKRKIKKIRQRLMALKYEFLEPPLGAENANLGYRTAVGTARAKILRWIQELQRLRQARKEGAASIGLIVADMIKFMDGKDPELQASRQAGLLDFIASALPASHTSKPEACHVTIHLLKLLKVVLSAPANRSYFLVQNLLPPIIPMLSAALENYIKVVASLNSSASANVSTSKTSVENFELISEVLDGFLWTASIIIGHISSDERQLQMRDGLLELLIAYQIIHWLRDLFALYDRPQTEGAQFPSSILLSIHLLEVLTSRPGNSSIIDWESFACDAVSEVENQENQINKSADSECNLVNFCGDESSPSVIIDGADVPLLGFPKDQQTEIACKVQKDGESILLNDDDSKRLSDGSTVLANNVDKKDFPTEFKRCMIENTAKTCLRQKNDKQPTDIKPEQKKQNTASRKPSITLLLTAISETGLVSLPSLLTAVLLQANNKLSSEQSSYVLPTNFEEVATGVLKVLNNLALLDIIFLQKTLARPDLKMEFFHLLSFLLSHCSSRWKVASDQVGLLLIESLLLLGNFSLFHHGNQAVLRWGKSPTILHKICDLPFSFFSDPELMPVMAGTLIAACYGCEQNKGVVQLELSTDMLFSLLNSCKSRSPPVRSNSNLDNAQSDDFNECNPVGSEMKKPSVDSSLRFSRCNVRNARTSQGKGGASGSSVKIGKPKNLRDWKTPKPLEEIAVKDGVAVREASSMMLHYRFPSSFIDKAEQYFSCLSSNLSDQP